MGKPISIILLTSMFIALHQLAAAAFDGSEPLLCAVIEVAECDVESGCRKGTVESMDIPQFIRIDFEKNRISGKVEAGRKKESEIKNLERVDGKLIMQGVEGGRGWSMVISENTGKMSATASEDQFGFVVFGACTIP